MPPWHCAVAGVEFGEYGMGTVHPEESLAIFCVSSFVELMEPTALFKEAACGGAGEKSCKPVC